MKKLVYLKDVVTLELDREKCVGCGMCLTVCPHQVWQMDRGRAMMAARDQCMECGACALNCAAGAIRVESGVGCAAAIIGSVLPWAGWGKCSLDKERPGQGVCCG